MSRTRSRVGCTHLGIVVLALVATVIVVLVQVVHIAIPILHYIR